MACRTSVPGCPRRTLLSVFLLFLWHLPETVSTGDHWYYYHNIALGKPSRQIDTYQNGVASRANDGNPSGSVCAITTATTDTWWVVDLLESALIYAVKMRNRNAYTNLKLRDFYVYVSETNPLPHLPPTDNGGNDLPGETCLFHSGALPSTAIQFLPCDNGKVLRGRYVYVWKPGATGRLYLCELEALTRYPLREFTFSMTRGVKRLEEPYQTVALPAARATYLQCSIFCLNLTNATVDTMQFNRRNKTCSCFEVKPFNETSASGNNATSRQAGMGVIERHALP